MVFKPVFGGNGTYAEPAADVPTAFLDFVCEEFGKVIAGHVGMKFSCH